MGHNCPICLRQECRITNAGDRMQIICDVCGIYILTGTAASIIESVKIDNAKRAAISHQLRRSQPSFKSESISGIKTPLILNSDALSLLIREARLPIPPEQASNVLRAIGQHYEETGRPLPIVLGTDYTRFGSFDYAALRRVLENMQLFIQNVGTLETKLPTDKPAYADEYDLTLKGWDEYEKEKKGKLAGDFAFFARKFSSDEIFKSFIDDVLKPCVKEVGYELRDMLDMSEAGIIDNIMRERIQDCAFMIADLTHDNYGAYWEAGYAEGLGKPVIYICEESKFKEFSTHFDTNHHTTVLWRQAEYTKFQETLVATIKRSLRL